MRDSHVFISLLSRTLALSALLACSAATMLAQHTVVEKNGVGGKIEMDYDAAERVTQMRTIGADGSLQQKVEYEYLPGYYGPQQTDTTYWSNGKIRKIAHHAYDESSNFTGEFIQAFDESGRQVAGHKLTHDPWTRIYRCSEWNMSAQDYKAVECPAGEEESGGVEEVRKFTYEEVVQHLEAARKADRQEQKVGRAQPASPVESPRAINPQAQQTFRAQALCLKGGTCVVSGPFNGDRSKTFAAFEDRPATIVAETSDTAYIQVPEQTGPGARPLFIAEGSKVIALPVAVGELVIQNNGRELKPGQTLIMSATLDGAGDLPEAQWLPDNFPAANIEQARRLIPGFQLPGGNEEKRGADEEEKDGEILLVIKNPAPEQISLRGSKNDMLVFHLGDEAFARGAFKCNLLVEAKQAGTLDIKGYVIPLLAPVTGQEFEVKTAAH